MLKLTVKPGEYLTIGDDIRIVFTGGGGNNMYIMVEAPKEYKILRSKVIEKITGDSEHYYKDKALSEESQREIRRIIATDKSKNKNKNNNPNG